MLFSFRRFDSEDEHVLGEPALLFREIGSDPESETLLAQKNIAAVTGPDRDDGVVLREMADPAALRVEVEQGMDAAIEFRVDFLA